MNTYAYVEGNPINYIDPDGLRRGVRNAPYSRVNRQKAALQARKASLQQRPRNLQNNGEKNTELAKAAVAGIEELQKQIANLSKEFYPMKCVKYSCPWESPKNDVKSCPVSKGPSMTPPRGPEGGCKCVKQAPAW